MRLKLIPVFLVLLFSGTIACSASNQVTNVQQLWGNVIASKNSEMEKNHVGELKDYIRKREIGVQTKIIDPQGNMTDYSDLKEGQEVTAISILFHTNEGLYRGQKWVPKDHANISLLLK